MQYPTIAQPQYAFAPTMPMMAEGGLVPAARAVQSKGRNGDSMLVHMTPGEVGGLQALAMQHGGSLTTNPQTGLPEANFLKSLLPTLFGAGLMLIPGVNALGAGLITGGIQTARTGDLGQGLLAGLGAFGGANLAGSLMSSGTAATAANAATAAGSGGAGAAGAAIDPATFMAETGAGAAVSGAPATVGAGSGLPSIIDQGDAVARALTPTQQLTTGAQNIFASGPAGDAARTAAMGNLGGYSGLATQAGMAAAPALLAQPELKTADPEKSTYEGPYTPTPRDVRFPTAEQRQGLGTSEFQYFTDVNPVPGFQPFSATQAAAPTTLPSTSSNLLAGQREEDLIPDGQLGSGFQRFVPQLNRFTQSRINTITGPSSVGRFATGGVPTLEDGGFVLTKKAVDGLGKGDNKRGQQVASAGLGAIPIKGAGAKRGPKAGVDDKIKTSIEGKRPALVSNGEAYVPKKQVAKHGGAKKFYALMKKAEKRA